MSLSRAIHAVLSVLLMMSAGMHAGEEFMPLAPGASPDPVDGTDKPTVHLNVIKLILPPITHPEAAAKIRADTTPFDTTETGPRFDRETKDASAFLPPPPRETAHAAPARTIAPATASAPASAAPVEPARTFSPVDHTADIPGLVTPELIVWDKTPKAFSATTYSAARDDLFDLIHAEMSLPISSTLPAMPTYKDADVTTLEPFVPPAAPRRPRPEQLHLPPPIASDGGISFPGFGTPPPAGRPSVIPEHEAVSIASRVPPHTTERLSIKPPEVETIQTSQPLSLRPPPESARKTVTTMQSPTVPVGSPLLAVPPGMSLTGTMPLTDSGYPEMTRYDSGEYSRGILADSPPPSRLPTRRQTPHLRAVPAMRERTVPNADPDDEHGFTTMRSIRNLLGP